MRVIHASTLVEFNLEVFNVRDVQSFDLEPRSCVWNITRPGRVCNITGASDWSEFLPHARNVFNFRPLVHANSNLKDQKSVVAVEDLGQIDGVRKIIIGKTLPRTTWFLHLLFADSLGYLTAGVLALTSQRHLLVDIDDVFITKIHKEDLQVSISSMGNLFLIVCSISSIALM